MPQSSDVSYMLADALSTLLTEISDANDENPIDQLNNDTIEQGRAAIRAYYAHRATLRGDEFIVGVDVSKEGVQVCVLRKDTPPMLVYNKLHPLPKGVSFG